MNYDDPTPPAGDPPPPEQTQPEGASPVEAPLGDVFAQTQAVPPPDPYAKFPEDLRVVWGWLDLGLLIPFAILSLVMIQVVLTTYVMARYSLSSKELVHFMTHNVPFLMAFQLLWFASILAFLAAIIRLRRGGPFWQAVRWSSPVHAASGTGARAARFLVSGVGLAIMATLTLRTAPSRRLPMEDLFETRQGIALLMAYGILVAPLVEEMLFRGFIYPVVARSLGVSGGVIITGMLFGLLHAAQLWGGWVQIGWIVVVGMLLTLVRARTGSVLASYLIHLAYNTTLFSGVLAATRFLQRLPPKS